MRILSLSHAWTVTASLFFSLFVVLVVVHLQFVAAQTNCCRPPVFPPTTPRFPQGVSVRVYVDMNSGFTDKEFENIKYGLEDWNDEANSSGVRFIVEQTDNPPLVGPNTPNVIVVTFLDQPAPPGTGGAAINVMSSGANVYATMKFYNNFRQNPDTNLREVRVSARHEAAHGLGLENGNVFNTCPIGTTIMYPSFSGETFITNCDNSQIDTQTAIYPPTPTPTPTPCAQLNQGCAFHSDCCPGYVCGEVTGTCYPCEPDGNNPQSGPCMSEACSICYGPMEGTYCDPWTETCWTPILIDVNGNGIDLTDIEGGVWFDGFGTGVNIQTAWSKPYSDDAWLVLDRDGNGVISNGTELFSGASPQPMLPPPDLKHGFNALVQYDRPEHGGNSDGLLDRNDLVFSSLRLWQDVNHNGSSEDSELHPLDALGLRSISANYKLSKYKDEHGNSFRYRAAVKTTHGVKVGRWAYDVYPLARP